LTLPDQKKKITACYSENYQLAVMKALTTNIDAALYWRDYAEWYSWVAKEEFFQMPLLHALLKAGNESALQKALNMILMEECDGNMDKMRALVNSVFVDRKSGLSFEEYVTHPTSPRCNILQNYGFETNKAIGKRFK